jgi:hypothetical protein
VGYRPPPLGREKEEAHGTRAFQNKQRVAQAFTFSVHTCHIPCQPKKNDFMVALGPQDGCPAVLLFDKAKILLAAPIGISTIYKLGQIPYEPFFKNLRFLINPSKI